MSIAGRWCEGSRSRVICAILTAMVLMVSASSARCEVLIDVPSEDPAMAAAFARAAAGLDDFLAKWRSPPPHTENFGIKIGVVDRNEEPGFAAIEPNSRPPSKVEFLWMTNLKEDGDGFSAQVANEVEYLDNVRLGDTVHFKRSHIADWMYVQDGRIVGNATACPALAHGSAEEKRQMKEVGIVCD
ncbi:MAG: DUF2314 domain-containing protein [Alphaproteobacteria bacterium]|nr:DUF2314 domain-containing protein [Alphaproteobacteria bacterium]